ncbi:uncharacterized protein MAM_01242 [Metarhizium album ARSEF 1941]|uniref:Rhodopsin domain-containing protein n=1 Tax=Metarhizium album (strain ARSEF 1941) TaxID=1081103 RepID=A0A0B2X2G5_METAS|nr:uncharacterized protein MAM_01242 [Metarhizium album ARSEF 1941]KHO00464.1 hypothetical protein MAM_01242 [Metarhizium album ARSEF 1941]
MGLDVEADGLAALSGTFLVLAAGSVVLRFVARSRQKARVWMDDHTMALAWVGFVGLTALSFFGQSAPTPRSEVMLNSDLGRRLTVTTAHVGIAKGFLGYEMPRDRASVEAVALTQARTLIAFAVLTATTFGLTKLSALFFYRRIFCVGPRGDAFDFVTAVFVFLVSAWTVTFIVVPLNLCGPLRSIEWDIRHASRCDHYAYFKGISVSDFILDVAVLVLPLPKIWSLNMTTVRKIAVSGLGASTTRLVIMMRIVHRGRAGNARDTYQGNTRIVYYGILEAAFNIVAINGPSLWYLVAGIPPDRVLHSIRTFVSLGSSHRPGSSKSSVDGVTRHVSPGRKLDDADSSPSSPTKGSCVETYAMADVNAVHAARGSQGGIVVGHEFKREIEQRHTPMQ